MLQEQCESDIEDELVCGKSRPHTHSLLLAGNGFELRHTLTPSAGRDWSEWCGTYLDLNGESLPMGN